MQYISPASASYHLSVLGYVVRISDSDWLERGFDSMRVE